MGLKAGKFRGPNKKGSLSDAFLFKRLYTSGTKLQSPNFQLSMAAIEGMSYLHAAVIPGPHKKRGYGCRPW